MLFAIAVVPVALAAAMYFGGWGATGGVSNKGDLLQPVVPVETFGLAGPDGEPLEERFYPVAEEPEWLILMLARSCDQACEERLHDLRQVHVALGRESDRVQRAVWAADLSSEQLKDYPELMRLQLPATASLPEQLPGGGNLAESYQVYVVDPNGNVILRYDSDNRPEDLLDDVKRLLRLSNIG